MRIVRKECRRDD